MESELIRAADSRDRRTVQALLQAADLEPEFVPGEFVVCEVGRRVVACARANSLGSQGTELSSVAVDDDYRKRGIARSLVMTVLLGVRHPVYALALEPEVFARLGFEPVEREALPPKLVSKISSCDARKTSWVPMRLKRSPITGLEPETGLGEPGFLDQ